MVRNTHRLHKQLAAAISVVALAVPATSAATVDLRNPDSKAAAIEAQHEQQGYVDLRSPDSKDAAINSQPETGYVDLRSPDAKDVGRVAQTVPPPEIVQAPAFDWGDAGIGAGSVLGLLLIALSVMFAVAHRRGRSVEGQGDPAVTT